jgi:hypothetical protein
VQNWQKILATPALCSFEPHANPVFANLRKAIDFSEGAFLLPAV